jgi:hypothetical protein
VYVLISKSQINGVSAVNLTASQQFVGLIVTVIGFQYCSLKAPVGWVERKRNPTQSLLMLGFVPQPNLRIVVFLAIPCSIGLDLAFFQY